MVTVGNLKEIERTDDDILASRVKIVPSTSLYKELSHVDFCRYKER